MPNFYVADAHSDFLYCMVNDGQRIDSLKTGQCSYLPYMLQGGCALQFFAAWIDTGMNKQYFKQFSDMADAYDAMLLAHPEFVPFSPLFSPESGRIATVLTVEGGEAIEGDLSKIELLAKRGVKAMTLTWNETNELAGAAMAHFNRGLTALGKEVVRALAQYDIAVDVAHLSDAGIDCVLETTSAPIFASHSNSRKVLRHKRNLQDAHIVEIADRGGVVCVNYYYKQLCRARTACIDDIVRHIDHIANLVGIDHVALGSDFDGMNTYPVDLNNASQLPDLLNALKKIRYTDEDIRKIAYCNLRNFIAGFF